MKTTAILPTGTRIDPKTPAKNEYFGEGAYLLIEQVAGYPSKTRRIMLAGAGPASGYPAIGESFYAHHDQTLKQLGRWTVVAKVDHDAICDLPYGSVPLYVYK